MDNYLYFCMYFDHVLSGCPTQQYAVEDIRFAYHIVTVGMGIYPSTIIYERPLNDYRTIWESEYGTYRLPIVVRECFSRWAESTNCATAARECLSFDDLCRIVSVWSDRLGRKTPWMEVPATDMVELVTIGSNPLGLTTSIEYLQWANLYNSKRALLGISADMPWTSSFADELSLLHLFGLCTRQNLAATKLLSEGFSDLGIEFSVAESIFEAVGFMSTLHVPIGLLRANDLIIDCEDFCVSIEIIDRLLRLHTKYQLPDSCPTNWIPDETHDIGFASIYDLAYVIKDEITLQKKTLLSRLTDWSRKKGDSNRGRL